MWLESFDGIFVINLPSRADRRQEINQQLSRFGFSLNHEQVVLFPAVRPDAPDGFPSVGARGCFMSHLGVLRSAQAKGMQRILILEDDCDFSKDVQAVSACVEDGLKQVNWTLFYGGALNEVSTTSVLSGLHEVAPTQGLMGSHCIAVNDDAIGQIADYLEAMLHRPPGSPEGGPMHVDGAYSWFRQAHPELTTLMAMPELAFQRSSATDVHTRRWFDRWPLVANFMTLLRKIKNSIY